MTASSSQKRKPQTFTRLRYNLRSVFTKCNDACNRAARIENANLAGSKTRTASGVVDCVIFLSEHRLDAWRASKHFQPFRNGLISMIVTSYVLRFLASHRICSFDRESVK